MCASNAFLLFLILLLLLLLLKRTTNQRTNQPTNQPNKQPTNQPNRSARTCCCGWAASTPGRPPPTKYCRKAIPRSCTYGYKPTNHYISTNPSTHPSIHPSIEPTPTNPIQSNQPPTQLRGRGEGADFD
jgi:hypothetical protein